MNNKKNILLISAVFPPEPVVSAALTSDLADFLSGKHDVTVVSPKPSRPMGYKFTISNDKVKNYRHIVLKSYIFPRSKVLGRFIESYSFGKACYKYIVSSKNKYDVIYVNTWPLLSQYYTVKAAVKMGIPIVMHIQDIYPELLLPKISFFKNTLYKILLSIDKFTTRNSSKVITISNGMRNLLISSRVLQPEKVGVVYNWQDESNYNVKFPLKDKDIEMQSFTFMFLGSLSPLAAVDVLIIAFAKASLHNCRLVIAGGGSEKESLETLALQYPNANIQFIDAPFSKVGEIQAQSSVMLLSLVEGAANLALPSKLPAYMFSSKPIIAQVNLESEVAKAIINSDCGWLVLPGSIEDLSKMMKDVSKLPDNILNDKGIKGHDYAQIHFSKKENMFKLVEIIESTIL